MRGHLLLVACAALVACMPDTAHTPIFLPPPYNNLPPAPPGTSIEAGKPVGLDARQQEAVVAGAAKWMKNPHSILFGAMEAARNRRGQITVCGEVDGRNTAGSYVGMAPFVGVLMGPGADADFVLVGIGSTGRERAEVAQLCRDSGASPKG